MGVRVVFKLCVYGFTCNPISPFVHNICDRVAIKDPPHVDSLFRPFPFLSQSFGERQRVRSREFLSPFPRSTILEFFAMLISRPILRYEYYQIYCVLAALFSRFAFLSSEHYLLRISIFSCVSPATLARRRVRCVLV